MIELKGKYGKATIFAFYVKEEVISSVIQYLNHPASKGAKIAVMPDCHAGKGCVVGFTATLTDYVIPNIVGVDIGCGVYSVCMGKEIPPLDEIDGYIREEIPAGQKVREHFGHLQAVSEDLIEKIRKVAKRTEQDEEYALLSLGTLGGGNHFIEIGIDDKGYYWLTVHTGSRNFGLKVARYYQKIAENTCRKEFLSQRIEELKEKYSGRELEQKIEELKSESKFPKTLSFLTGETAKNYLADMQVAQEFARRNRLLITANSILVYFNITPKAEIESVHNYIDFEDGIIRKGAIRAHKGEWIVIPMNMAYGIVIGRGKGNPEWNYSAPHGAGRKLSRKKAKEEFSVEEFKRVVEEAGVYSSTVGKATLDEAPMAYKDPDEVLSLTAQTVQIERIIKPVYNFKGA